MRHGLRPRVVRQLFASMPAARSRCLSTFVAIARQGLPPVLRYEPSTILAGIGASLVLLGVVLLPFPVAPAWKYLVTPGWMLLLLAFVALVCQHRFEYGTGRFRLIRSLDEARRITGLDEAILPESLEFLEGSAFQWERIEHALQTDPWSLQDQLRYDIAKAAQTVMEEIVFLECGSNFETGFNDDDAEIRLLASANALRLLAEAVDAAGPALSTYPREQFESNGADPGGVSREMEDLEDALCRITDVLSRSEAPA